MNDKPNVMIIAGEISGDMHAAPLIRSVKEQIPEASFFGIGGNAMKEEGVEILHDVKEMAVMGFTEVMKRYSFFKKVFDEMTIEAEKRKPDVLILVDYPGFNLRFARVAHGMGIKVIYYICPQVWAWNQARIPKMAQIVDRLITIFPFEAQYFSETNLKVDFAGHPLVEEAQKELDAPIQDLPWNGDPRIALLPGSRATEINRLLPVMISTALLLEKKHPNAGFIIPTPNPETEKHLKEQIKKQKQLPVNCSIIQGNAQQILRQANAAIVTSGTATLQTALMQCPMIITYKMSAITYLLGKMLVKVNNIGMVNIVAEKEICPEFIQWDATPSALADAIEPLLSETAERKNMIKELKKVSLALGKGNSATNAAKIVVSELRTNS